MAWDRGMPGARAWVTGIEGGGITVNVGGRDACVARCKCGLTKNELPLATAQGPLWYHLQVQHRLASPQPPAATIARVGRLGTSLLFLYDAM